MRGHTWSEMENLTIAIWMEDFGLGVAQKKDLYTLRSVVENLSKVQDDLRNILMFALFLFVSIFLCYFWKERNKNFQIFFFFSSEKKYNHVTVPC